MLGNKLYYLEDSSLSCCEAQQTIFSRDSSFLVQILQFAYFALRFFCDDLPLVVEKVLHTYCGPLLAQFYWENLRIWGLKLLSLGTNNNENYRLILPIKDLFTMIENSRLSSVSNIWMIIDTIWLCHRTHNHLMMIWCFWCAVIHEWYQYQPATWLSSAVSNDHFPKHTTLCSCIL